MLWVCFGLIIPTGAYTGVHGDLEGFYESYGTIVKNARTSKNLPVGVTMQWTIYCSVCIINVIGPIAILTRFERMRYEKTVELISYSPRRDNIWNRTNKCYCIDEKKKKNQNTYAFAATKKVTLTGGWVYAYVQKKWRRNAFRRF